MTYINKIKTFLKIDEALGDKRNHHIDALKGLVIVIVVWAHAIQFNDPNHDTNLLYLVPYPAAMPLFMLLSGFLLSRQLNLPFISNLKKNAIRLLVPFFVWAVISYVFYHHYRDVSLPGHLLNVAKAPGTHLWFLWVLFWSSVLLIAVLKVVRFKNWIRWENYFVVAAILLSRAGSTNLFGLTEIKAYFIYYAAGFFIYKYFDVLKDKRKILYAVSVVVFPVLILFWRREQLPTFYPDLLQVINNKGISRLIVSIYKYVVAISGMAYWSFIMEKLNQTRLYFLLCWLGTLTLEIYVCQGYFIMVFGNGLLQYIASTLISIILSLALTLLILQRFRITRLLFLGQSR